MKIGGSGDGTEPACTEPPCPTIEEEEAARIAGDALLASQIEAEQAAREAADAVLASDLDAASAITSLGGDLSHYDDFRRPDGPLGYSVTPTGALWIAGAGEFDVMRVVDDQLWVDPAQVVRFPHIGYIRHSRRLDAMAMSFVWSDPLAPGHSTASKNHTNAVMGAAISGFGAGSIQLAFFQGGYYQLFCVTNPIIDPYPTIIEGPLDFGAFVSGITYTAMMRKVAADTIKILLPDGRLVTAVDNPALNYIRDYWPRARALKAGVQMRRQHDLDGAVQFTGFATGGEVQTARSSAELRLMGDNGTSIYCAKPKWTPASPTWTVHVGSDWDWAALQNDLFWVHESVGGDQGHRMGRASDGGLYLRVYLDGVTPITIKSNANADGSGAVAVPPVGSTHVRVTRDAVTGNVTFETSMDGAVWSPLGAVRTGTPGAIHNSAAALRIGSAGSAGCTGSLLGASIVDAGVTIASPDFSVAWPIRYADAEGNKWSISGWGYQWEATNAVLPGPVLPVPEIYTPGPTISSDTWTGGDVGNITGRQLDLGLGGVPKTWLQTSGNTFGVGISGGTAVRQAAGTSRRVGFDAGQGDVYTEVEVITKPTTLYPFLVARADPALLPAADTYYSVRLAAQVVLHKHVGGVSTVIGASKSYSAGDRIGLLVVGTTLSMTINGVIRDTIEDTSIPATNTQVGLAVPSTATGFVLGDYFVAQPAA